MLEQFTSHLETISKEDAPHLHAAVEDLCSKAGISKPILCFAKKDAVLTPLYRYTYDHMAAAMNIDGPRIIVGEEFRKVMDHHSLGAPISEEFKAVLAHEIGHLKHGDTHLRKILPLRFSPHLGFAAGLAAIWLYDHFSEKKKEAEAAGKPPEEIHKTIHQEWEKGSAPPPGTPKEHNYLATAVNYLAGGMLGFGIGTAIFALLHRRIEFRADKTSAELMGDGKPLARALKIMKSKLGDAISKRPDVQAEYAKKGTVAKLLGQLTHPSTEQRIERLNAWAR